MVASIRKALPSITAAESALDEFVSLVAVTHIGIFWLYEDARRREAPGAFRLPFPTRATVRLVGTESPAEVKLRRIREVIAPHALGHAVEITDHRRDLIHRLHDLREEKPYRKVRQYLSDAVHELSQNSRKVDAVVRDISKITRTQGKGGDDRVKVEISVPGFRVEGAGIRGFRRLGERLFMPRRYFLREILEKSPHPDYLGRINKLFPELLVLGSGDDHAPSRSDREDG
jgi:hypothetical protein